MSVIENKYNKYGFVIFKAYRDDEVNVIKEFALSWLKELFDPWVRLGSPSNDLELYHNWFSKLPEEHRSILKATNRFCFPKKNVMEALLSKRIIDFLDSLFPEGWYLIENEGLGNVGFRLVRPGMEDGYPFSRKEWGPAGNVISFWIPILGCDDSTNIKVIPGSHKHEYEKILPKESKFAKDEYRLAFTPDEKLAFRPGLEAGEVLCYHPRLLHSEDVEKANYTRMNLEFRVITHS